ncbi:MAG: hypothetical protein KF752_11820 [Pirellulaceae bacterium]|nr:hypothetical protein [Pirellulaceae bacterium]
MKSVSSQSKFPTSGDGSYQDDSYELVTQVDDSLLELLGKPVVWKTEGLPDMIGLKSCMMDLHKIHPHGHWCWTNKHGAGENPLSIDARGESKQWILDQHRGKIVYVVHDLDKPGQDGATWVTNGDGRRRPGWATVLAGYADECRNIVLPGEIQETKGADLEDFLSEVLARYLELGYELDQARAYCYLTLLKYAQSQPVIDRSAEAQETATELSGDDSADVDVAEQLPSKSADSNTESDDDAIFEADDDPHRLARINLERYQDLHEGNLAFWAGEWWKYRDGQYRKIELHNLKAKLNATIRQEFEERWRESEAARVAQEAETGKEVKRQPVRKVTEGLVKNVIHAMESMKLVSDSLEMPCWIPDRSKRGMVSMQNGILDLDALFAGKSEDECLIPHTKDWFSTVKLPFEFDRNARCPGWVNFLETAFNGDAEAIRALQMWFGYLLTQDTYLQKMMMVIGPTRSGKGTISRTLKQLLGGNSSVCNPTLADMADKYELQSWNGKSVAIINEARLPKSADESIIVERLLSIVGEDSQEIKRKFMVNMSSVKMNLRFMMFTNQIPRLNDSSAAIVGRCIILVMPNSYLGREDVTIGQKIERELPGIFRWSLAGRKMLIDAGKIEQPKSGLEVIQAFKSIASPMTVFIEEECVLSQTAEIEVTKIFEAWKHWCLQNGIQDKDSIQLFARKIHDAIPGIQTRRLGYGDRQKIFIGIDRKNSDRDFF